MATFTVPRNDKGYYLNFTVQDSTGTAFNLTSYTITLKIWSPGNPGTLLMSGACSIVSAAAGTCRYSVGATDFTLTGTYNMELELTQSGVIESTRLYTLEVTESP